MTSRPLIEVLAELDRPVDPDATFAHDLFARLEAELGPDIAGAPVVDEAADGPAEPVAVRALPSRQRWYRQPLTAAAALLVVALAAAVIATLPGATPSALAVYDEAARLYDSAPAIRATVMHRTAGAVISEERLGDEKLPDLKVVKRYQWQDDEHFRTDVVANSYQARIAEFSGELGEGSWVVADGTYIATYRKEANLLAAEPLGAKPQMHRFSGLGLLDPSLHPFSRFSDAEFEQRCTVEENAEVAGRAARHIRCTEPDVQDGHDVVEDLWVDGQYGFILRYDINGTPTGSGFVEIGGSVLLVEQIEFDVDFPRDTFIIDAPAGAVVQWNGPEPTPEQFKTPEPQGNLRVQLQGRGGPVASTDDAIWTTGLQGGRGPYFTNGVGYVVSVDPVTGKVLTRTTLTPLGKRARDGKRVEGAQLLPDGDRVWVQEYHDALTKRRGVGFFYRQTLEAIDSSTGTLLGKPGVLPGQPAGIARTTTALWIGAASTRMERVAQSFPEYGEVLELDPLTRRLRRRIRLDAQPSNLVAAGGAVWLLASEPPLEDVYAPPTWVLLRIDPASGRVSDRIVLHAEDTFAARAMVATRDAVLVALTRGRSTVLYKVDAGGRRLSRQNTIRGAFNNASVDGGRLWLVDVERRHVVPVDTATLRKAGRPLATGQDPDAVTAAFDRIWVSHFGDGDLRGLDPSRAD